VASVRKRTILWRKPGFTQDCRADDGVDFILPSDVSYIKLLLWFLSVCSVTVMMNLVHASDANIGAGLLILYEVSIELLWHMSTEVSCNIIIYFMYNLSSGSRKSRLTAVRIRRAGHATPSIR
jgi:hypothetical protein